MWPRYSKNFTSLISSRFWQSQFSLRFSQIVIRVILSEKTLKINAVKWPRIYIQTYNRGQKLLGKLRPSLHFGPNSIVRTITVISGRLPAGNVSIFPQTVVGAGYRKVRVM